MSRFFPSTVFPHILPPLWHILFRMPIGKENDTMAEQTTTAPAPQDLDDYIFRWDSDIPTVSDR